MQVKKPKHWLEEITGKPVNYFAYPYGTWNDATIQQLKDHGYKAAFQLLLKQKAQEPLYTIRRMLVVDR
jgi:peptidoglycan/xylan/chitin deacetylase (PgdA/CDA1 family)